jgi:hypothetical protein
MGRGRRGARSNVRDLRALGADVTLRVTPPGMSQTFTVPISVGRNEGLCNLQIHPLTD